MNDRCAAGTGKSLEVMAQALAAPLDQMGPLALAGEAVHVPDQPEYTGALGAALLAAAQPPVGVGVPSHR
jgi:activator of 2-hydroxyglutaryl-CoA dehydratase